MSRKIHTQGKYKWLTKMYDMPIIFVGYRGDCWCDSPVLIGR